MPCVDHPTRDEAFGCPHCDVTWCRDCVEPVGVSGRSICPRCGHQVRVAMANLDSDAMVRDSFARVASMEGLTTSAGFAVFWALSAILNLLAVFYLAALVSYYFAIVRHVGDGKDGLPGPSDATEDWIEIGGFVVRGVLCALIGFIPLIVYARFVGVSSVELALVLVVAGQALVPAALLAIVASSRGLAVIWPPAWIAVIARAPASYGRFVVIWLASVVTGVAVLFATRIALSPIPLFGGFLSAFVWGLFWFAQATLVGHFLRNNAERFAWH